MIKNYFKTLLRNMQKNKLHTSINIVGMAVAFTCSILLFLTVVFLFSFDKFHEKKDRIYKVYTQQVGPEGEENGVSMAYPLRNALLNEKIGIEKATLIRNVGHGILYKDKELELDIKLVDNDFFDMFTFPVVKGNKAAPLGNMGDVVLSEHAAKTIFSNNEDPIGKAIKVKIAGTWQSLVVSSVIKDFPDNSSLNYDVLARTELHDSYPQLKNVWDNQHSVVYAMASPNTTKEAIENGMRQLNKYQPIDTAYMKNKGYIKDAKGDYSAYKLLPLPEMHFSKSMGTGNAVNRSAVYILLLIGVMILLIACFNFVNLNIGISFTRAKEMGIRKCLGAGKKQVWLQVWGESFFTCFVALVIAIIASALLIGSFNKMHVSKLNGSMLYNPTIIAMFLGLLIVVSFVAGGYPSSLISKLKTTEILKGKFSLNRSGFLRSALIVVQFVIACVLICTTAIIYQQFQHLRKASLGYSTTSLISVPLHNGSKSDNILNGFRNRLVNQSSIVSITGSNINMGLGKDGSISKMSSGFDYNGRSIHTNVLFVDYDFLKTLDIKPLEGRDFSSGYFSDTSGGVIVTQSMAKQLTDGNALGLTFQTDTADAKLTVVGIIPDFHLYSMYEKTEPLTIRLNSGGATPYALIRVRTNNPTATMDLIKNTYSQLEPGAEFKGTYVDENIERWYSNEKDMASMFSVAAVIAITLSCMGLFGIALIAIRQRVKEIGVRKVLGASVAGIASMVTKDFIKPVIVAILIALPISWWAMHQWLQDFVYRISISWWVFLAAGLAAILIAILTVSFHAVKAAVANPVKSLRSE